MNVICDTTAKSETISVKGCKVKITYASADTDCLDAIQTLEQQGIQVKVSDLSDALSLPRPGVTRTVKDMEARGLLTKHTSPEDGRVTYLTITEAGRALSRKYDAEYFSSLVPALEVIPEEDAETMIRTIEIFYQIMVERRDSLEK